MIRGGSDESQAVEAEKLELIYIYTFVYLFVYIYIYIYIYMYILKHTYTDPPQDVIRGGSDESQAVEAKKLELIYI